MSPLQDIIQGEGVVDILMATGVAHLQWQAVMLEWRKSVQGKIGVNTGRDPLATLEVEQQKYWHPDGWLSSQLT